MRYSRDIHQIVNKNWKIGIYFDKRIFKNGDTNKRCFIFKIYIQFREDI